MTRERWQRIEELYEAALGLPVAERSAFLELVDPELRATIVSIFSQDDAAPEHGFSLDLPAWEGQESSLVAGLVPCVGEQLGPYRIEQRIGHGGMGEVFRATDIRLHRTVAIKITAMQFTERFEREARVIASLNHPHIAALYDVGSSPEGLGYLVLEYIDGPTLAEVLKKGPIASEEVQRIALQIAEAIEAAHEKGVVHRDLKPSNIKFGEGGAVKVLDFGLAKAMMDDSQAMLPVEITQEGIVLGTPPYMSPEQALGGHADRRSDIWSFGVVVSEMLLGKRLFSGATKGEVLASVVRGEPDLSAIPPRWMPLLQRCLTKDVRRRLQSIGEARVVLEDGLPYRAEPARKMFFWPIAATAAILALVAILRWTSRDAPALDNPLANASFTRLSDNEGGQVDASISPDGKFVAFLSDRAGPSHVWLQQVAAGNAVDLTPGPEDQRRPLRSIGFSRDGAEIWLAGTNTRRLQMLPLVGGKPRVFLNEKVVNPVWSPDGSKMAYHFSDSGDPIFVADGDGSNPRQIYRDISDKHNHYLAWAADGTSIYYVHGTPATNDMDLWRISAYGGKPERLTTQDSDMRDPTPLGKEQLLYLAKERDGSGPWIWSFDLARRVSRRIAFGLEQYTSLSASANGERLAVTVANPVAALWSVPILDSVATETDVKPLSLGAASASMPRLRGTALYYWSSPNSGDRLWRLDAGKRVEIWRGAHSGFVEPPAISPDGRQIVVVTPQDGNRRLRLISSDGAESHAIAPEIDVTGCMDWSPDGKWIVTGGNDGTGAGLFKIPVSGGKAIRLTSKVGRDPVWSPDGSMIAYSGPNVFTLTPLMMIRPDGTPISVPPIGTQRDGERLRFLPNGLGLVYMEGSGSTPWQDFWLLDLTTMSTRRLTHLEKRATMRTFDITPDSKNIAFERLRDDSSVVLIDLRAKR